tara:strand:- start:428 stop:862 length:435 start_codon:yes stop_codon:yes gene_type:complete
MIGIIMPPTDEEKQWMDEHFYLPHETIRDYDNDSFFEDGDSVWIHGKSLGWNFMLFVYEDIMFALAKKRKEEVIFNGMMAESRSVRNTTITSKRSTGWGRKATQYKPQNSIPSPKKKYVDGPIVYKGKTITKEEAEKINKSLDE